MDKGLGARQGFPGSRLFTRFTNYIEDSAPSIPRCSKGSLRFSTNFNWQLSISTR